MSSSSVRLDVNQYRQLQELARRNGLSMSEQFRRAVLRYRERQAERQYGQQARKTS